MALLVLHFIKGDVKIDIVPNFHHEYASNPQADTNFKDGPNLKACANHKVCTDLQACSSI